MSDTTTQFKHDCNPENARLFWHWIKTRQGVANWKSINLSNPGASWSTPVKDKLGETYTKPNWQCGNEPEVFTNPDEIGVGDPVLYKAVPVALRRSSQGFSLKLTDGSQRKIDRLLKACEDKHGHSYYKKGVLDIDGASIGIYYDAQTISLTEWIAKHGEGDPQQWD